MGLGAALWPSLFTLKHSVQSARSFTDIFRCSLVKTGPSLQLKQPNISRDCSREWGQLGPGLAALAPSQLSPLGHKAHGEHSSLPGDTQGLKPPIDMGFGQGACRETSRMERMSSPRVLQRPVG